MLHFVKSSLECSTDDFYSVLICNNCQLYEIMDTQKTDVAEL